MNSTTPRSVPAPNHTQTPNLFYDEMLAEIDTMSELKVTLAIIRKTFGWHKAEGDQISLSQLEEMTGMERQQVVAGCKAALARGYVWREKREGRNWFGLNVEGGYDDHTPMRNAHGYDDHTDKGYDDHTHKRKGKESVVSSNELTSGIAENADSAGVVIGLEKHLTDKLFTALDKAGYTLDNSDYGYHLGRAKTMLEKMNPSDDELEWLPAQAVAHFEIHSKTDAMAALRYMRQQKARRERLAADRDASEAGKPSFYEQQITSVDKPRAAAWYASLYDVPIITVRDWIAAGAGHSEIEKRLESGAVA